MKRNLINYFGFGLICAALFSCSKDAPVDSPRIETWTDTTKMVQVVFTAGMEDPSSETSKVFLLNKGYFRWKNGDNISVFPNGSSSGSEFTNNSDNAAVASFSGSVPGGSDYPYYALYPYQSGATKSDGVITAEFPSEQVVDVAPSGGDYDNGNFGVCSKALIAVAKLTSGSAFEFKNIFGLLMVTVPENSGIKAITVESINNEPLSGSVNIKNIGTNSLTCEVVQGQGKPYVTLKASSGNLAAGRYLISVLPGTYSQGLRIIVKKDGAVKAGVKNNNSSISVARNDGAKIPADLFSKLKYDKYYYLLDKDDMDAWNGDSNNWSSDDVVYLGADIDYGATSDNWNEHDLKGTFDGRGHSITGFKSPLFNDIYGPVKNFTLTSNVEYNTISGSAYGVGLLGKYAYDTASISNVTVYGSITLSAVPTQNFGLGGILGSSNGCPMTNCTNNASISVSATLSNQLRVGGVAGQTQHTNRTYENCTNNGGINIGSKDNQGNIIYLENENPCYVGGCFGYSTKSNTYKGCKNTGRVDVYAKKCPNLYVGGMFAHLTYNSKVQNSTINSNTLNSGTVYVVSDSGTYAHVGGIVGYTDNGTSYTVQIKDTKNEGAVYLENSSVDNAYVGGVVGLINNKTTFSTVSNSGKVSTDAVSIANSIHVGGVIGAHSNTLDETFTGLSNSGEINTWKLTKTITGDVVSCFGGIEGGKSSIGGKTYSNCTNTGAMQIKGGTSSNKTSARAYIGGIAGYTDKNPSGSSCEANITVLLYSNETTTSKCCVGGICGLWNFANVSDLKYMGTIQSTGSSPAAYISGIVGRTQSTTGTFSSCEVGGEIYGAGSSPYAGVFMSQKNSNTINFSNCKVRSGTIVKKSSNVTISSSSNLTLSNFCGGTPSTGSISDCSVVTNL